LKQGVLTKELIKVGQRGLLGVCKRNRRGKEERNFEKYINYISSQKLYSLELTLEGL
jgi:hypothetical protein